MSGASRFETHHIEVEGQVLCVESAGSGSPVLLLHGFTGSTATMRGVADGLVDRHRVISVDLLGHGRSSGPEDPARYRMERAVAELVGVLDALALGRVHVLGYSMGGRVALALAVAHPERIASLVAVGASAGLEDERERHARRAADEALAASIEQHGLARFVDRWMEQPLFASQRRLGSDFRARARAQRLQNRPHALAASLRGLGLGAQPPLHDRLADLERPVLLVAGAEDTRFLALASDLQRRLPRAEIASIPAAGHAPHLENPAAFLSRVRRFLATHDQGDPSREHPLEARPQL